MYIIYAKPVYYMLLYKLLFYHLKTRCYTYKINLVKIKILLKDICLKIYYSDPEPVVNYFSNSEIIYIYINQILTVFEVNISTQGTYFIS